MSREQSRDAKGRTSRALPVRTADGAPEPIPKDPVPLEKRPQPGSLPAADDGPRTIGKQAARDLASGREDPDQAGRDAQRREAPANSPTRRGSAD